MKNQHKMIQALEDGMEVATGCTEPVAIAYAGAVARSHTQGDVARIRLDASANMIKNAFVVGIPGTELTGLQNAVALGAVVNNPSEKLNLLSEVTTAQVEAAVAMVREGKVDLQLAQVPHKLYIKATVETDTDTVSATIIGTHTGVSSIVRNGKEIYNGNCNLTPEGTAVETPPLDFTLRDIYDFSMTVSLEELGIIKEAIRLNREISREGMTGRYGLCVGHTIQDGVQKKLMADDVTNYAMMMTAAGSDARMAGADKAVMTNSGSGNQGIAATVPVLSVWEKMGKSEEQLIRACALSNLVTIYIKSKFGVLSALCGAVVAGTGVACAVVYLMDGTFQQMEMAVQNVLGNVTGMLCDGAKSSCALKISTCVNAAMQAAMLAMNGHCIGGDEGIVERLSEHTIDNFAVLGKDGAEELDRLVLDMIINKRQGA